MKEETTCKHYNGTINKTCRAGVCYDEVIPDRDEPGSALRMPCHTQPWDKRPVSLENHARRGTCPKLELPNAEEIKEKRLNIERAVSNFQKSLKVISAVKQEHEGKDWQGTMECPVCQGVLHMGHAAYNGHTRGKCATQDCLNWIE